MRRHTLLLLFIGALIVGHLSAESMRVYAGLPATSGLALTFVVLAALVAAVVVPPARWRSLRRWLFEYERWTEEPDCYEIWLFGGLVYIIKGQHPAVTYIGKLCFYIDWDPPRGIGEPRRWPHIRIDWNPL